MDELDPSVVYKDDDFEKFIGFIHPPSANQIIGKLFSDSTFLEYHNIMDYSILLKICKPSSLSSPFLFHSKNYTFCIGIIDFLQKYTWSKSAEVTFKSILNKKNEISC